VGVAGSRRLTRPTSPRNARRSDAVGVALALMARLPLGHSSRQAGNRPRVAPARISPVPPLPIHATASASTVTNVAHLSHQSCEPDHGRRPLRSTDGDTPAALRFSSSSPTTADGSSTWRSPRRSARAAKRFLRKLLRAARRASEHEDCREPILGGRLATDPARDRIAVSDERPADARADGIKDGPSRSPRIRTG
jgi:hypothetical protein